MTTQAIQIEIMGRTLRVNCPLGQEQALQNAASEFDSRIQQLSERTKMSNNVVLLCGASLLKSLSRRWHGMMTCF